MVVFQEHKLSRDIYIERRWYGLALANPLPSFELIQSTLNSPFSWLLFGDDLRGFSCRRESSKG
jgi:hypothetical protein